MFMEKEVKDVEYQLYVKKRVDDNFVGREYNCGKRES